jgi:hypothetical protein
VIAACFDACLERFSVGRRDAQPVAIKSHGEQPIRVNLHGIPVVGLQRVIGIVEAAQHA